MRMISTEVDYRPLQTDDLFSIIPILIKHCTVFLKKRIAQIVIINPGAAAMLSLLRGKFSGPS
jgi:hypothetical protein